MKNLFKKVSALLMAAIMVLSMCTAVFAETKNTAFVKMQKGIEEYYGIELENI